MSLDDFEAQLRGALDQQLTLLKQRYEEGLAEARRQAAAEAERDAATKVNQVRAELDAARAGWDAQLHEVTAAVSAEAEHQVAASAAALAVAEQQVAGLTATRADAEQASQQAVEQAAQKALAAEQRAVEAERRAADATGRADEAEQRLAETTQREREAQDQKVEQAVAQTTETLRRGGELALEAERQRAQAEIDELRQLAAAAELTAAKHEAASAGVFERLLAATRALDGAQTLSQTLESLLEHAGAAAGRAAVFLIDGDRLKAWKAAGIPDADVNTVESSIDGRDLLARAIQTGQATSSSPEWPAPPFARLPAEGTGLAAPLMIGGRAVAVLYADGGANPPSAGAAESVEALVRHASAIVALRTAMRTLDVIGGPADETAGGGEVSDDQSARRYARLLVSEIKLYNEGAVRVGRLQRDLRHRLREEIDRAQRLYEERVPPAVAARQMYFQQELVQTLADGDATLLGSP